MARSMGSLPLCPCPSRSSSPSRVTRGLRPSRSLLRVQAEKKKELTVLGVGESCLSRHRPQRGSMMGGPGWAQLRGLDRISPGLPMACSRMRWEGGLWGWLPHLRDGSPLQRACGLFTRGRKVIQSMLSEPGRTVPPGDRNTSVRTDTQVFLRTV